MKLLRQVKFQAARPHQSLFPKLTLHQAETSITRTSQHPRLVLHYPQMSKTYCVCSCRSVLDFPHNLSVRVRVHQWKIS